MIVHDSWWSNGSARSTIIDYHGPFDQGLGGCRQCRTPFGRTSPACEILLVVKTPKQVQLQDLFNILIRFLIFFILLSITLLRMFFSIIPRQCTSYKTPFLQLLFISIFQRVIRFTYTDYISLTMKGSNNCPRNMFITLFYWQSISTVSCLRKRFDKHGF